MEPDISGFKKGLAGIMIKHQLASISGYRGQFIGYWGERFYMYCQIKPSTPIKGPFADIFERPTYNLQEIVSDLKALFDYYGVRNLTNQYLETFYIAPDDNNQFRMEFVNLEFFETKIKGENNNG